MRIAVISACRGTGRTTVAANLALSLPGKVRLLDCDVMRPHCREIVHPTIFVHCPVPVRTPVINVKACTGCGDCAEACKFNALKRIPQGVLLFPDRCHACGACVTACRMGVVTDRERDVASLERGTAGVLEFAEGHMENGQDMYPPVVQTVLKLATPDRVNVIDLPPSPLFRQTILPGECDYAVLVAEASTSGLEEAGVSVAAAREAGIEVGVVLNRVRPGDEAVGRDYCAEKGLSILLELPEDARIADAMAAGEAVVNTVPEYRELFEAAIERIPCLCPVPLG